MVTLTTYLQEAEQGPVDATEFKPVVIAPGRFNPPHLGHKLVIDTLVKLGQQTNAKPIVIIVDSTRLPT